MQRNTIKNQTFDLERSLYNLENTDVVDCIFKGENDGESVLKETRNCLISNCEFGLRYPLWHAKNYSLVASKLDENTRAPIWYSDEGIIKDSFIYGVKCLRECKNTKIYSSTIDSKEFGWKCENVEVNDSILNSEYIFFGTNNVILRNVKMSGKYSFQYMNNVLIEDSILDTKDAFWHSNNVTVKNSIVKGEYLGWFSDGLKLINCRISGTQPLCYCKNLVLIDCEMENTDLSFEYSDVNATIKGEILSIKNPKSGEIICDSVKEIIKDHTAYPCNGKITVKK